MVNKEESKKTITFTYSGNLLYLYNLLNSSKKEISVIVSIDIP